MQLEIDHSHLQAEEQSRIVHHRRSLSSQFKAEEAIKQHFQRILIKSGQKINGDTIGTLAKLRELREKRVYSSLNVTPLEYLFILFEDRREHLGQEVESMEKIMKKKHKNVVSDLLKDRLKIEKHTKSISQIKRELEYSLEVIRNQSPEGSAGPEEDFELVAQKKRQIYQQFMKKGYWKAPNEKTVEVREFLKNVKQKQAKHHQRYKQHIRKERQARQAETEKSRMRKEAESVRLKEELQSEFNKKRGEKLEEEVLNEKKLEEVESYLKKFREKPPNYIIFSQRYKQKEKEEDRQRKEFLTLLKMSKRHSSLSQMKEDIKKYDQVRTFHQMEKEQEKKIQQQLRSEAEMKLRGMYQSRIYSKSLRQTPPPIDSKKVKQQHVIKMQMYSQEVSARHPPKVDDDKRQQLMKSIVELNKKQDHKIRKYREGEEIVIDKSELNPRKIGLEYLEEVKKITSSIQRKPPPTPELNEKKLVDRSLLKNTFYNRKVTISNWKEIMDNKKLSPQQKEEQVKVYFDMVEQKRLKSLQEVKKADQQRALSLHQMIDHYEVEKTAAKLALLRSMK